MNRAISAFRGVTGIVHQRSELLKKLPAVFLRSSRRYCPDNDAPWTPAAHRSSAQRKLNNRRTASPFGPCPRSARNAALVLEAANPSARLLPAVSQHGKLEC